MQSTPWGVSEGSTKIVRGAVFHYTARHGGLGLTERLFNKLSDATKKRATYEYGRYWFEEDLDWAFPINDLDLFQAYADAVNKNPLQKNKLTADDVRKSVEKTIEWDKQCC